MEEKFQRAIEAFDRANSGDPNRVIDEDGRHVPRELHHARHIAAWLDQVMPGAPIPLRLAARCQHLRRWEVPRKSYPEGRMGYLTWRKDMKTFHATHAAKILGETGFGERTIARVRQLNLKENLKSDPECQALEDALCLTFLETQFASFSTTQDEDTMIRILQKTWKKMSPRAHELALSLAMGKREQALVERALGKEGG